MFSSAAGAVNSTRQKCCVDKKESASWPDCRDAGSLCKGAYVLWASVGEGECVRDWV